MYNCRGRYNNGDCDNKVNILERTIEDYLLQNADAELERYVCELACIASEAAPARNFQEERTVLRRKLSRLKDLYVDEIIDLDLYRKDYETLNAQLSALTAEEAATAAPLPSADRLLSIFSGNWKESYMELDRAGKQAFWRTALDKILIHPTRQISIFFRP